MDPLRTGKTTMQYSGRVCLPGIWVYRFMHDQNLRGLPVVKPISGHRLSFWSENSIIPAVSFDFRTPSGHLRQARIKTGKYVFQNSVYCFTQPARVTCRQTYQWPQTGFGATFHNIIMSSRSRLTGHRKQHHSCCLVLDPRLSLHPHEGNVQR